MSQEWLNNVLPNTSAFWTAFNNFEKATGSIEESSNLYNIMLEETAKEYEQRRGKGSWKDE